MVPKTIAPCSNQTMQQPDRQRKTEMLLENKIAVIYGTGVVYLYRPAGG